jgi:hypothetical protein
MIHEQEEKKIAWEVTDIETLQSIRCETPEGRDCFKHAIELLGHRVVVVEVSL